MRPGILLFGIFGAAAGCATATPGGQDKPDARIVINGDAPIGTPDAPIGSPDAPVVITPDGPSAPVTITLSQTTSNAITALNSVACANSFGVTAENSYYRAFPLSDFGITGAFTVTSVTYGVESAVAEIGTTQGVLVRVHSYSGASGGTSLNTAQMTQLASVASSVTNTSNALITANLGATIPAGGTVVAEVFVPDSDPDGDTYGNEFYIGSNASGETKPGYIRAPDCGSASPAAFSSLGLATTVDIVLSVTGTYNP